jgi:hypothetical protein
MNESIKQLITCAWCKSILEEPVMIPCGETVCRKHSFEISGDECIFCDKFHVLQESEQFPANKVVQNLLALKIKELDFGPNYKKATERVNELNTFLNDYDNLKKDPEVYISAHFSKQRNNIDLAREKLILEINNTSDRLISEIDSQEKECKANLSKSNMSSLSSDDSESIKADLRKWEQDMKYLVVNDNLWTSISTNCSGHLEALNKKRSAIEEKAFGNLKRLKSEKDISETFIQQLTA